MPTVSKRVKSLTTKTAEARLAKMRLQVERLRIENRRLKGEVAPVEELKRGVLSAITVLKDRLLALPAKIAPQGIALETPAELEALIRHELQTAINELVESQGVQVTSH